MPLAADGSIFCKRAFGSVPLIHLSHRIFTAGRFILSPGVKQTDCGQYAASVSIRSGRGSAAHDRVFRFIPLFPTAQAAEQYALAQGMGFIRQPSLPA